MKKCLKCGFESPEVDRLDCPKCGAIYSKVEDVHRRKAQHQQASASLNHKLSAQLETETEEYPFADLVDEQWFERDQYPLVGQVSTLLFFLAACAGIVEIFGLYNFYQFMSYLGIYSKGQIATWTILLSIGGLVSVATIVAISCFLTMARDQANDTRATKEFVRRMASRTK